MVRRLRIEVASDAADRAAVLSAAEDFARARGVDGTGVRRVVTVLEALLGWAASRAYPAGSVGPIAVQLQPTEGGLEVLISDEGHPGPDFGGAAGPVPNDLDALSDLIRDVRQVNLADEGTRLSAVIAIEGLRPSAPAGPSIAHPRPARVTPGEIVIRDGRPGDASAIVDLLFTCYGLSYGHPDFYRPDWIAEQMRAGRVLSTVGVFRGDVIAHHALLVTDPGAAVETAVVVVHPAFRSLGIVANHLTQVLARAAEVHAPAILSRAVTHHPYSQMAERALGFRATGLLLGAAAYDDHPRSALTVAYLQLEQRAHAVSFPVAYAPALAAAYANAAIDPAIPDSAGAQAELGDEAAVSVAAPGLAVMPGSEVVTVSRWDDDVVPQLVAALRAAVRNDVEVIYADLDLRTLTVPELDDAVALLREYDFFYSGLVLFGRHGHDYLRLQAMLTDHVQVDGLVLEGDYLTGLYELVVADAGPRLPTT